jgi:hypothetical protein
MLFEPGPLTPFTDAEFPQPGVPLDLVSLVAPTVDLAAAGDVGIGAAQLAIGQQLDSPLETDGAADLMGAIAAHGAQPADVDPEIGGIVDQTAGGEQTIDAEHTEVTRDLAGANVPGDPPPLDPAIADPLHPPGFDDQVIAWYRELLFRDPSPQEIDAHRDNPAGLPGVYVAIITSQEYRDKHPLELFPGVPAPGPAPGPGPGPGPGPAPPPTGDPFADAVIALYVELLGRVPSSSEIDSHRGNPGGIDGVRQAILDSDEYKALHGGGGTPPPPSTPCPGLDTDPYAQGVIDLYLQYYQRCPSQGEIDAHRGNPEGLAGVEALLRQSLGL